MNKDLEVATVKFDGVGWNESDFNISAALEELQKYRNLEENGLLLKLPVAIEQEVYRVNNMIIPMTVTEIAYILPYKGTKPRFLIRTVENKYKGQNYYSVDDIGRYVFLTKEAAEKALEQKKKV